MRDRQPVLHARREFGDHLNSTAQPHDATQQDVRTAQTDLVAARPLLQGEPIGHFDLALRSRKRGPQDQ